MKYNNKIDVIIPVYNTSNEMLSKCLSSIVNQEIIKDVLITVVDDASTEENYETIIESFKPYADIQLLRLPKNAGPGVARQYAIDHTENEFITFVDSDDTFAHAFALTKMRCAIAMENNKYQMVVGGFYEIFEKEPFNADDLSYLDHKEDMVWLFAKLYRREFLEKNQIRFHPTSRSNEDAGFNAMIQLCLTWDQVNFVDDFLYYWHNNPESITRSEKNRYAFNSEKHCSFYGYVENMTYAIEHAKKINPDNMEYINFYAARVMQFLYTYYLDCCQFSPKDIDGNLQWCNNYYNQIYKDAIELVDELDFAQSLMTTMEQYYHTHFNTPFITPITYPDFIQLCKNFNEEE